MYVSRVQMTNVRGFDDVDLDLSRADKTLAGWIVIAGRNGAGKSTFLRSVALSIAGPTASRSLQESYSGWIRNGEDRARVATLLTYDNRRDRFEKKVSSQEGISEAFE